MKANSNLQQKTINLLPGETSEIFTIPPEQACLIGIVKGSGKVHFLDNRRLKNVPKEAVLHENQTARILGSTLQFAALEEPLTLFIAWRPLDL